MAIFSDAVQIFDHCQKELQRRSLPQLEARFQRGSSHVCYFNGERDLMI